MKSKITVVWVSALTIILLCVYAYLFLLYSRSSQLATDIESIKVLTPQVVNISEFHNLEQHINMLEEWKLVILSVPAISYILLILPVFIKKRNRI